MKKTIFMIVAACSFSASAYAIDLSESAINTGLSLAFPKDVKGFHVQNPKVELKDGNAVFCAIATPKLFPKEMRFCTSMVPDWHPETGSLHAKNLMLASFAADGLPEQKAEAAKATISKFVLPLLEGMQIYQTKSWIGKRVSSVTVSPGKVALAF